MALHPYFPDSPHAILDPDIRWFPADEALRATSAGKSGGELYNYIIAVSNCVTPKNTREVINIQKLNAEITGIVARQNALRTAIDGILADWESHRTL